MKKEQLELLLVLASNEHERVKNLTFPESTLKQNNYWKAQQKAKMEELQDVMCTLNDMWSVL